MILYSTHITPRLKYMVDFFSTELFNRAVVLTDDKEMFIQAKEPKINYSTEELCGDEFYMKPVSLLFENYIRRQEIECFELNYHQAFFQSPGDFPFDIFAATFYLLSRYEEYLPFAPDSFGRFPYQESLAYRKGFLEQPLINTWIAEFRTALDRKFPEMVLRRPSFQFIPTYDIDMAYSYLHKGAFRNFGGWMRSLLTGRWSKAVRRIQVLRGSRKDPFDSYEWLDSLHLYCRMKPFYFFLVAKDKKGYDRNISPRQEAFQDLIKYHAAGYQLGIHPSWQSGDKDELLKEEIEWLTYIANRKISMSRQHYIRMTLPKTYRKLIKNGITREFSMGYGSINGFRASIASPFYWFDLERGEATDLQVFPFCFMDANSFYEQRFSASKAMEELMHYYHVIKKVNGTMITIWHNNLLGSDPEFKGWKEVYEVFLKEQVYWDM